MGFEILKPRKPQHALKPFINVQKTFITFSTAFVKERGWQLGRKYFAVLMRDTQTGNLVIDFKDERFPGSFAVLLHSPATRIGNAPSARVVIPRGVSLPRGRFEYEFDGRLCRTNIPVTKTE